MSNPHEARRLLLGIESPEEDVEVSAIEKRILKPNWREIVARKREGNDE